MICAVASIATAVPETVIDQHQGLGIARAVACPSPEQESWLPGIYAGTQIEARHTVYSWQLVRDVIEGTRHSDSVFLPTGDPAHRGPTTGQRMQHYAALAPPLGGSASRQALSAACVQPEAITHLVTVS